MFGPNETQFLVVLGNVCICRLNAFEARALVHVRWRVCVLCCLCVCRVCSVCSVSCVVCCVGVRCVELYYFMLCCVCCVVLCCVVCWVHCMCTVWASGVGWVKEGGDVVVGARVQLIWGCQAGW